MPKPIKLAINGLGRVGRVFLRVAWDNPNFEIVAANSRSDVDIYAHLLKYDSIYGKWDKDVTVQNGNLMIDTKTIWFSQGSTAGNLPWNTIKPDIVLDASGKYRTKAEASEHIQAGARYVVVSAPMDDPDQTFIYGINHQAFDPQKHIIVSAASCTSVCTCLVVKVLEEHFGIKHGFINTVHAFTQDQNLHDASHKDLRRARAATESIIPTSTGMTKTVGKLFPRLANKLSGLAMRVPIPDPSVLAFTAELNKIVTREEINQAFVLASENDLKGQLEVSHLPLVSADFKQISEGAVIDAMSTEVVDGNLVNILAWYDNEWGYVSRMTAMVEHIAKNI